MPGWVTVQFGLTVPALEDKLVKRASVEVLNAINEQDFLGFSYGFRPCAPQILHPSHRPVAAWLGPKSVAR